jgi:2-polyprenyl-6-methoxyphenol hydroxylase-like FAD-dependent oxidoreductase
MPDRTISTRCCVAGGGPAGMMLGFLLARAGIDVVVLERHADFFRDFRGDTIHPSTLEVMHELGLLDEFLKNPHQKMPQLGAQVGDTLIQMADFSHLPTHCKFIAFMPQWDFLNFLAEAGKQYPTFHLMMNTDATGLIRDGDRVVGVTADTADGKVEIRAELVVATDGRNSTLRPAAGFEVTDFGAPMDVLWLRLSHRAGDPGDTLGHLEAGLMLITIDRGDYWQCAYVIPKGGIEKVHAAGLPAFRAQLVKLAPHFANRVDELQSWDQVKLLTVAVNRLSVWYREGFLCIGDAAHAMSPIGGVGVNMAVQDAVATANILVPRFRQGQVTEDDLRAVQQRREFPVKMTQRMQITIQNRVITRVLSGRTTPKPPVLFKLFNWFPILRRLPGRMIGMGVRPEHIRH